MSTIPTSLHWRKSSHSSPQGGDCVEVADLAAWRKSTHSSAQGGNCVEVADLAAWRKSTHSSAQGGQCVEVAPTASAIAIRDSKNPTAPALAFSRTAFRHLNQALRTP
ncbi:DUF397 domain-containing protein [Actinocorallia sp. API 0066]|uniref:DUF397 domain-containing protein n=1 Tax=Actinocorallia sp. API 0066 TaxID=2896846 RepID=UPI001E3BE4C8|nr:DUF397 domain-containing protein [Actinocorallia sp. API 0066]MCD0453740.1 DUF397 domain-containing protein [Actinocorallia sp. API 0066]